MAPFERERSASSHMALNPGAIAGIVTAGTIVLIALCVLGHLKLKYRKRKESLDRRALPNFGTFGSVDIQKPDSPQSLTTSPRVPSTNSSKILSRPESKENTFEAKIRGVLENSFEDIGWVTRGRGEDLAPGPDVEGTFRSFKRTTIATYGDLDYKPSRSAARAPGSSISIHNEEPAARCRQICTIQRRTSGEIRDPALLQDNINPWELEYEPNPVIFPHLTMDSTDPSRCGALRVVNDETDDISLFESPSRPNYELNTSEATEKINGDCTMTLAERVELGSKSIQNPLYVCPDCHLKFSTAGLQRDHYNRKHNRRYICTLCDAAFNLQSDLQRHEGTVHKDEMHTKLSRTFTCPNVTCTTPGKEYGRKDNFRRHVRRCKKASERAGVQVDDREVVV